MTLGDLKSKEPILTKLLRQELPVIASYQLSKIVKTLRDELTILEDLRTKLVVKHGGEKYESNGTVNIPPDSEEFQAFLKEYTPLLEKEVAFHFEPIRVGALGECKMQPVDLADISEFITG